MSKETLNESGWEFNELGFVIKVRSDLTGVVFEFNGQNDDGGDGMFIPYVPDFFKAMKRASQAFNERYGNE